MTAATFVRFPVALSLASVAVAASAHAQTAAPDCEEDEATTGLVPLPELRGQTYRGLEGGLYPGGVNQRPSPHQARGLYAADRIVPLDPEGRYDPAGGRIGFAAIGLSNARLIFGAFQRLSEGDPDRSPAVTLVNAAEGGVPASQASEPESSYWNLVDERVAEAELTNPQVQAVWLYTTNPLWAMEDPDTEIWRLRDQLRRIVAICGRHFPNLRAVYLSGREFGGYGNLTGSRSNIEPHAYEQSFSCKLLVSEQVARDRRRDFTETPWVTWGTYLWADATTPRRDGLVWRRDDFVDDGIHPSSQGSEKAARLVIGWLENDPTTAWYRR